MRKKCLLRLHAILSSLEKTISLLPRLNDCFSMCADDAEQAREKFVQETALFLLVAKRTALQVPDALDAELLSCVFSGLVKAFDTDNFFSVMKKFPQAALAFGPLAAALDIYGEANHIVSGTVRDATMSPFYLAADRPVFRQLEALWLRNVIQGKAHPLESMLRTSIIAMRTHPCFMRVADAYAKTHCAMYLTDFGASPRLAGLNKDWLKADLDHDLAWTFSYADWDLLGEILLAGRYCLDTLSPWHRLCETALDAVFGKFGFIPARTFDLKHMSTLTNDQQETYRLFHSYHSNVVYGLDLLSRLSCQKPYEELSTATQPGMPNPLEVLEEVEISLNFVGSGFDKNWYDSSFYSEEIDIDFMNDSILIRIFHDYGVESARQFMHESSVPALSSRTFDTWQVVQNHAVFSDRITSYSRSA